MSPEVRRALALGAAATRAWEVSDGPAATNVAREGIDRALDALDAAAHESVLAAKFRRALEMWLAAPDEVEAAIAWRSVQACAAGARHRLPEASIREATDRLAGRVEPVRATPPVRRRRVA